MSLSPIGIVFHQLFREEIDFTMYLLIYPFEYMFSPIGIYVSRRNGFYNVSSNQSVGLYVSRRNGFYNFYSNQSAIICI